MELEMNETMTKKETIKWNIHQNKNLCLRMSLINCPSDRFQALDNFITCVVDVVCSNQNHEELNRKSSKFIVISRSMQAHCFFWDKEAPSAREIYWFVGCIDSIQKNQCRICNQANIYAAKWAKLNMKNAWRKDDVCRLSRIPLTKIYHISFSCQ